MSPRWHHLGIIFSVFVAHNASAYPWFVRDGYTHCLQCHADPSGSGLLTPYGRAQSEILMRTHYGSEENVDSEPGAVKDFMWGAVELPEPLLLGADVTGGLANNGSTSHFFVSQADLEGQVSCDHFRVNASLGYAHEDAQAARVTHFDEDNLVARSYWAGLDLGEDDAVLLRLGRIGLPFGLRTDEQRLFIHDLVRNNLIDEQPLGVAGAYNGDAWRAEAMAYLGSPHAQAWARWEHGGSAYVEYSPLPTLAFGLSGLFAHSDDDTVRNTALFRGAYGVFARYAPFHALVVLAEVDGASEQAAAQPVYSGYAGLVQADFLLYSGLHLLGTVEFSQAPTPMASSQGRGRVAIDWFCLPHVELRLDGVFTDQAGELVGRVHVYL